MSSDAVVNEAYLADLNARSAALEQQMLSDAFDEDELVSAVLDLLNEAAQLGGRGTSASLARRLRGIFEIWAPIALARAKTPITIPPLNLAAPPVAISDDELETISLEDFHYAIASENELRDAVVQGDGGRIQFDLRGKALINSRFVDVDFRAVTVDRRTRFNYCSFVRGTAPSGVYQAAGCSFVDVDFRSAQTRAWFNLCRFFRGLYQTDFSQANFAGSQFFDVAFGPRDTFMGCSFAGTEFYLGFRADMSMFENAVFDKAKFIPEPSEEILPELHTFLEDRLGVERLRTEPGDRYFNGCNLHACHFIAADLSNVSFVESELDHSTFTGGTVLAHADLSGCRLYDTNFIGAKQIQLATLPEDLIEMVRTDDPALRSKAHFGDYDLRLLRRIYGARGVAPAESAPARIDVRAESSET